MALRFLDGGGLFYTTLTDKWDTVNTFGNAAVSVDTGTNGRWGGRCLLFNDTDYNVGYGSTANIGKSITVSGDTVIVQFAYNCTLHTNGTLTLATLYEGATRHIDVRLVLSGTAISVTRNGTQIAISSNGVWSTVGGWRYCKLKVRLHDTLGTVQLIQDNVELINQTGLDTKNGGTGVIDTFCLGQIDLYANGNAFTLRMQDIDVCDTSGDAPTDLHAEARVRGLAPSANGDTNNWTASAGSNYQCVDEIPNNGNTDYVSTSTVDHLDLYALPDLPTTPASVLGVMVNAMVAKDDAGTDNVRAVVKTGGTVYEGASVGISSATFAKVTGLWGLNPGGGAWSGAAINALQVGVKRVA